MLNDSLLQLLETVKQKQLGFYNYYRGPHEESFEFKDITDDKECPPADADSQSMTHYVHNLFSINSLTEVTNLEPYLQTNLIKELAATTEEKYAGLKLRIFESSLYTDSWGGGYGHCNIVIIAPGVWAYCSKQSGDW